MASRRLDVRDNSALFVYADDAERRETDLSKHPRCEAEMYGHRCLTRGPHGRFHFFNLDPDAKNVTITSDDGSL